MIKPKLGTCIDCTDGREKPLIAKRCSFHYQKYRAEVNAWKKEKREEMAAFIETCKKPKPIPKFSKKRIEENKIYKIKRLQFLSQPENLRCPVTGERATEIHHTYSGSWRSQFYLDESTWIAVSRRGHRWIHDHPEEAREKGLLK